MELALRATVFEPRLPLAAQVPAGSFTVLAIYGQRVHVVKPGLNRKFGLGNALLTRIGEELAPIAGAVLEEDYRAQVVSEWRRIGYEVEELPIAAPPGGPEGANGLSSV